MGYWLGIGKREFEERVELPRGGSVITGLPCLVSFCYFTHFGMLCL